MNHGKINSEIVFPIICCYGNYVEVIQDPNNILMAKTSAISRIMRLNPVIVDFHGYNFRIERIIPLSFINPFFGFSLKHAGFGVRYLDIRHNKIKPLSIDELKEEGRTILKIKKDYYKDIDIDNDRWVKEFENLTDREEALKFLFYFADPIYYKNPALF